MGNIFPGVGKAWKSSWSRESPRTWFCLSFQGSGRWPSTYTTQRNRYACDLHPYSTLVDPRRLHNIIISPSSVHHKFLLKKGTHEELMSDEEEIMRNWWGGAAGLKISKSGLKVSASSLKKSISGLNSLIFDLRITIFGRKILISDIC